MKIIDRCRKLNEKYNIQLRQSYLRTVRNYVLKRGIPCTKLPKLCRTHVNLEKWIKDALKELEINNSGNFHAIRKMRENQMIQDEDLDLNIVAEILGHTKRVQEKHYLEVLGANWLLVF